MPIKLPRPDEHGNFWLGRRKGDPATGPAIFPHKVLVPSGQGNEKVVRDTGKWTVLLPGDQGFLEYKDGERMMFDSLDEACTALQASLNR